MKMTVPFERSNTCGLLLPRILTFIAIFTSWVYVILRTRPLLDSDYAAFLLVGSRLAQGDKLYIDVWDNKDPLTYWIAALSSQNPPVTSHIVEIAWFATISIATYYIARAFGLPLLVAALAGGTLGPLAVLNLDYFPGVTELQGVALLMVVIAFSLRNQFLLSGLTLGILIFAKLIFFPVGILAALYCILRGGSHSRLKPFFVGLAVAAFSLGALLFFRGELFGYFETLKMNIFHSNARISDSTQLPIIDSIVNRLNLIVGNQLAGTLLIALLLLVFSYFAIFNEFVRNNAALRNAWWLSVNIFAISFVVIMGAAKFPHHLLLLTVPVILASLLTISVVWNIQLANRNISDIWRKPLTLLTTLVLALIATGVVSPLDHKFLAESGLNRINAESPESTVVSWLKENRQFENIPIAFLGRGSSVPITKPDLRWNLGCRFMSQGGQFSTKSNLDESLRCLTESEIVIVGPDATPDPVESAYNEFLLEARTTIALGFECSKYRDVDICFNRSFQDQTS